MNNVKDKKENDVLKLVIVYPILITFWSSEFQFTIWKRISLAWKIFSLRTKTTDRWLEILAGVLTMLTCYYVDKHMLKRCWYNIRKGGYLIMMLDYKGGREGKESGKKWLRIFSTYNFLIFCEISAEFYLYFNFIIIKIIMYNNQFFQAPAIYFQEYLKFLMKWKWK